MLLASMLAIIAMAAGGQHHLWITRIIRSLALCHQETLAWAFQDAGIAIGTQCGVMSATSLVYWREAFQVHGDM